MLLSEKDKETKNWLEIAKRDLEAGRKLASTANLSSQASFFSQQAAEKALKGFLFWHQERFKKDHDLRYLGDLALRKDSTLSAVISEATMLNPYAVTFRYPGDEVGPTQEEAEEALNIAERLFTIHSRNAPPIVWCHRS
jgi:HEPN domain-containing protein